jgi:hypothetical protein
VGVVWGGWQDMGPRSGVGRVQSNCTGWLGSRGLVEGEVAGAARG